MIPRTAAVRQTPAWQRELAEAITNPAELLAALNLGDPGLLAAARAASAGFPLRVPWSFVRRMRPGDVRDPLLRQVLPLAEESAVVRGYGADPVGDLAARVSTTGVLHKYANRVLLTLTGACALHCRYCFRRHFPYAETNAAHDRGAAAADYVRARGDLSEVVLSGGDPLVWSDRRLSAIVAGLEAIPHLRRLRLHTRLPVVLPGRVTDDLLAWLGGGRLAKVVVIHANHANEIDEAVSRACARLASAGVRLLNQSVLLRGVNDDVDALVALSERLMDAGVLPYYLHMLDKVQGAAHFDVPESRARELHNALQARLPGYLVPKLVREDAGAPAKTLIL